jgi:SsrA-binding protein
VKRSFAYRVLYKRKCILHCRAIDDPDSLFCILSGQSYVRHNLAMAPLAENSRVRFDYEILETYTAGIELLGFEVKAVRAGKMNIKGSYVAVRGSEVFLLGAEIAPYQPKNTPKEYEPARARKLLLSKEEIKKLSQFEETKGLTIVPLSVYNKGRFLKVDIAIVRGKKKFDKRESIKKRDVEREIGRTLKR